MTSVMILLGSLFVQFTMAEYVDVSTRVNGYCKQMDLPIPVTADTAIYDTPTIDSNLDAIAWSIYSDTRTTIPSAQRIIKNTTTSDTFSINVQLCVPREKSDKASVLQIATHGVHYDSRYWDPELNRQNQSYVEASLRAGYSILTYDRLGVGQSDHPDAYNVVQAPLELELLRQITLMARNGTLYKFAEQAKPEIAAFSKLIPPTKIVHVGHSFGSVITSAFVAMYGKLTDGALITGYLLTQELGKFGYAAFHSDYAATSSPPFNRTSGYIVCKKSGIQTIFFAGDPKTAFTQEMLDYGDSIKQPVPVGEFLSAHKILGLPGPELTAPVQYLLPEFDFYICGGDCKNLADPEMLKKTYPNASAIEVAIHPNTGHAFTLHNNATAGFQLSFDFLARHGL